MKPQVLVEIVSDVACPWCYVGKRNFEKAAESLKDKYDFKVTYLPYELDSSVPKDGIPRSQFFREKFGPITPQLKQYMGHLGKKGQVCGIDFCYNDILEDKVDQKGDGVISNTLDSHRLIHFSKSFGESKTQEVVDKLFSVYHEAGLNVSKLDVLLKVAEESGLDKEKVKEYLLSDKDRDVVKKQDMESKRKNIRGVPHFTIMKGDVPPLTEENLKSFSIKDLRIKLRLMGVDFGDCIEKEDLIKRIIENKDKHPLANQPSKETLSGAQDPPVFAEAIESVMK